MNKVIVFGIGNYYKTKEKEIKKQYEIIGFVDNTVRPGDELLIENGKRVVNPDEISVFPNEKILLMSTKFLEMREELLTIGVEESRILFGIDLEPAYNEFEISYQSIGIRMIDTSDGIRLFYNNNIYNLQSKKEIIDSFRRIFSKEKPEIEIIANLPLVPLSSRFGHERGTPIDRFYIDRFIEENRDIIQGDVAEIAGEYALKYGHNIKNFYNLHVNGWGKNILKGNLVTGEGISDCMVDCLICTQTIQCIYEMDKVIENIYRLLKPQGIALITAHGLSQLSVYDYNNWGEYWRFTEKSLKELFSTRFSQDKIEIKSYGNVKIATALLYGLCMEDLTVEDYMFNDYKYPIINTVKLRR